jgi:hypothetical protein
MIKMRKTDYINCDTWNEKGLDNKTLCDGGLDCWQRNNTISISTCKECDCFYCEKRKCRHN